MFITFEGIDGSGKSTQIELLKDMLIKSGRKVKVLREPGSTGFSEKIRELLLSNDFEIGAISELLLFNAARSHLIEYEILPALANGEIVLCDRFYDSTTAYQGYGRGININDVNMVNKIATGGLAPDITFFLDLSLAVSNERTKNMESDRIESSGNEFFENVRKGFLKIADMEPDRVIVINSDEKIEDTHRKIINILKTKKPKLFESL